MSANLPRLVLLALVAVLSLAASACGSTNDAAVATVGSATLRQADFEAILETNGVEDTSVVSAELASRHISEWIFFESWIDLATTGGTELNGLHLDLARVEMEEAKVLDPTVPLVDTPYGQIMQRHRAVLHLIADHIIALAEVTALCSSHLLVATEQQAAEAVARLDAGEDFAALATELSVDPSAPSGGDLGCVVPATFVPEFVDGAAAVGGPGISSPVQSQFGWHVIHVRSFGPVVRGQHEELASAEVSLFVFSNFGSEFQELLAELYDRDIRVDPRFGVFDATSGSVVRDTAQIQSEPADFGQTDTTQS